MALPLFHSTTERDFLMCKARQETQHPLRCRRPLKKSVSTHFSIFSFSKRRRWLELVLFKATVFLYSPTVKQRSSTIGSSGKRSTGEVTMHNNPIRLESLFLLPMNSIHPYRPFFQGAHKNRSLLLCFPQTP